MSNDIENIPVTELLQDLHDSVEDILNCRKAIKVGVLSYGDGKGGRDVVYRLEQNQHFVKVISNELKRRGLDVPEYALNEEKP